MHRVIRAKEDGTSLIEVLMAIVVVAVSLGIGLPSFQTVIANSRMASARSDITVAFAHARSEAVKRAHDVIVCPVDVRGECAAGVHWHLGWSSFADLDGNGSHDPGEPRTGTGKAAAGVKIVATGGRRQIRYRADGSAEGSNVTMTFCDHRGTDRASALALNNAGRLRRVAVTPGNAAVACAAP